MNEFPIQCRHGGGFSLTLTFSDEAVVAAGMEFLRGRFPGIRDLKRHRRTVSFHVPDERVSGVLGDLLANRARVGIVDFGFKEISLDDVFIKLATEETMTAAAAEEIDGNP